MTNLRKLLLVAVIAAPLALYSQPIEKPDQQISKAAADSPADATHQPKAPKHAWRSIKHDLNPVTWVHYLSQREYCTYAFSQAYGYCEGSRGGR